MLFQFFGRNLTNPPKLTRILVANTSGYPIWLEQADHIDPLNSTGTVLRMVLEVTLF